MNGALIPAVLTAVVVACLPTPTLAQAARSADVSNTVDIELLTHAEVSEKIHKDGKTSVIIVAGGTEERGPHDVLGGHNIIARYNAIEIARKLGNALVAPVLPISVAATGLRENTSTPGGVQMPADVFKAVQIAEIESMAMNGFKDIFVMGDHGGGQQQIREAAEEEDAKLAPKGVHVYYIPEFYSKTHDDIDLYLYEHKLPIGGHGAMMETSEMLYMEPGPGLYVRPIYKTVPFRPTGQTPEQWKAAYDARMANGGAAGRGGPAGAGQRGRGQDPNAPPPVDNGLTGDPHPATKEIGRDLINICVNDTVAAIRKAMSERRGVASGQ